MFVAALLLLGATIFLFTYRLSAPVPWAEEWIAPPTFGQAMLDLSSGRPDDGQRRLNDLFKRYYSAVWSRRAALALGVARLRRREYSQAHKALAEAELGGGPLAPFASLKRAEALLGAGKSREAAELLDRVGPTSTDPLLADEFAIERAQALVALGRRASAREVLAAHLQSAACRERGRVMEAAAKIAEEGGDAPAAIDLYRRIYFEEPRTPEAARGGARLSLLLPPLLRFRHADLERAASRSRALVAAGDGKGALATWDLVLAAVPLASLDPERRWDIAEAAVEAREFSRAFAVLGRSPVARGEARRGLLLARALFGLDRDGEAIATLRIAAEGPSEEAAASRLLLATALDQADRDREALEQFVRFIKGAHDGERSAGALWRAGWLSVRLGRMDEAQRFLQSLLERPDASAFHPSALYWLARANESRQRRSRALDLYRKLARTYTRDYYGLLASRRLSELGHRVHENGSPSRPRLPSKGSPDDRPLATRPEDGLGRPSRAYCVSSRGEGVASHILAGCEFETIGFFQDAEHEYEAAAAARADRSILLRLSEFAFRRGDRTAAVARLKSAVPDYLAAPIDSLPQRYWDILYPRREWDRIVESSRLHKLDPALVCGLILQESAFNPLAVSAAGAMGLMQVRPGTGMEAAAATGERGFTAARLLEPATNLRIGTWHLASLLERTGGRTELALAAYNAGEGRLTRWQQRFGTSDPTTFVEDVPFTETRLYVKRILSHAAMYRILYGP